MPTPEERIKELEKEVKRLNSKVEALVNHLAVEQAHGFAPPEGRAAYDKKVEIALAEAYLSK